MRTGSWFAATALAVSGALHMVPGPPTTLPTNCTAAAAPAAAVAAGEPAGHAHNDYRHAHPLTDALAAGFTSVEADVWPVDGDLLVAHTAEATSPGRSLRRLYLEPLRARLRAATGVARTVRAGEAATQRLQLLVDVKGDPARTLPLLEATLADYAGILTSYRGCTTRPGPVSVVVSGRAAPRPPAPEEVRYYGYDVALGRFDDRSLAEAVTPLASAKWRTYFTWNGFGPMPADQRRTLDRLVVAAHEAGSKLRLYDTPELPSPYSEPLWSTLARAGVDYLNTDDLAGYARFCACS